MTRLSIDDNIDRALEGFTSDPCRGMHGEHARTAGMEARNGYGLLLANLTGDDTRAAQVASKP